MSLKPEDVNLPGLDLMTAPGSTLLPGDAVGPLVESPVSLQNSKKRVVIRIGPGLTQRGTMLHAAKAGQLTIDGKRSRVALSTNQRRYIAQTGDSVIGIVTDRIGDDYRLDINGADFATLPVLAFEGATKKNRPHIANGAAVYGRVGRASRNIEPELTCIEPGSARSWSSGETLYGELKRGMVVTVSLALASSLSRVDDGPLAFIGQYVSFESAVGANGRVWVLAGEVRETIVVAQAVKKADVLEVGEWKRFVQEMTDHAN